MHPGQEKPWISNIRPDPPPTSLEDLAFDLANGHLTSLDHIRAAARQALEGVYVSVNR